jgi:hypothetical protein
MQHSTLELKITGQVGQIRRKGVTFVNKNMENSSESRMLSIPEKTTIFYFKIFHFLQEITVDMDFILKWQDMIILFEGKHDLELEVAMGGENISKTLKSLDPEFLKSIWKPDIFIG